MGIGVSVFLIAVGAILSFAVQDAISGVNLVVIGYILMAAGVLGIIIALVMNNQRTHTTHTTVEDRHVHNDY